LGSSEEPLDETFIHPRDYALARRLQTPSEHVKGNDGMGGSAQTTEAGRVDYIKRCLEQCG